MVAYIRVKQYTLYSGAPNVTLTNLDGSSAGFGCVLRSLSSGVVYHDAPPSMNDGSFSFGEAVTLVARKDGPPPIWTVEKDGKKSDLPEYLLARSKEEVDFLQKRGRIPDSMALVYIDKGSTKSWGVSIGGMQDTAVVDCHGLPLEDYAKGSSPFAIKGNAVVFDDPATKRNWDSPAVFDSSGQAFQLKSWSLYYCVSDGDKPAFEAVDPYAQ